MRIELLYFEGCPNYKALLPRLRRLLDDVGVEDEIELRSVETAEAAEVEHFLGSPTVRIDGEDVDPGAAARTDFGHECRLYRSESGTSPLPPDEWIRAALDRARSQRA